jgi:hypothetical protein
MYDSSGVYPNHAGINWYANWSGASGADFTVTNGANTRVVKSYAGLAFGGVEFYDPNQIDTSAYSALHVDVWTPNANQFAVQLVSLAPTVNAQVSFTNGSGTITSNNWISLDIPLNQFAAANPAVLMNHLQQLLWIDNATAGSGVQNGTFYIDNVYFWTTNVVKSSISPGASISWTANSTSSYQPQQSANNSTWSNLGPVLVGNSISSLFQTALAPYYRVLEMGNSATNSVADPGFELNNGSWLAAGSGGAIANPVTITNLDPRTGSYELDMEGQGTGAAGAGPVALQNNVPASAGAVTLSFYAKGALKSGGCNPQYCVFWFDAANALLGGGFTSFPTTPGASYTLETANLTAPANTTHAQIQFLLAVGAGTTDHWLVRIDDVSLVGAGSPVTNTLPVTVQSGVGVTWPSGKGLTYTVQSKTNLTGAVWSNLGGNVTGTGTNSVSDTATSANKFYRVLEVY